MKSTWFDMNHKSQQQTKKTNLIYEPQVHAWKNNSLQTIHSLTTIYKLNAETRHMQAKYKVTYETIGFARNLECKIANENEQPRTSCSHI
jgi:high-affinity Fe2+/Pb2+ permease